MWGSASSQHHLRGSLSTARRAGFGGATVGAAASSSSSSSSSSASASAAPLSRQLGGGVGAASASAPGPRGRTHDGTAQGRPGRQVPYGVLIDEATPCTLVSIPLPAHLSVGWRRYAKGKGKQRAQDSEAVVASVSPNPGDTRHSRADRSGEPNSKGASNGGDEEDGAWEHALSVLVQLAVSERRSSIEQRRRRQRRQQRFPGKEREDERPDSSASTAAQPNELFQGTLFAVERCRRRNSRAPAGARRHSRRGSPKVKDMTDEDYAHGTEADSLWIYEIGPSMRNASGSAAEPSSGQPSPTTLEGAVPGTSRLASSKASQRRPADQQQDRADEEIEREALRRQLADSLKGWTPADGGSYSLADIYDPAEGRNADGMGHLSQRSASLLLPRPGCDRAHAMLLCALEDKLADLFVLQRSAELEERRRRQQAGPSENEADAAGAMAADNVADSGGEGGSTAAKDVDTQLGAAGADPNYPPTTLIRPPKPLLRPEDIADSQRLSTPASGSTAVAGTPALKSLGAVPTNFSSGDPESEGPTSLSAGAAAADLIAAAGGERRRAVRAGDGVILLPLHDAASYLPLPFLPMAEGPSVLPSTVHNDMHVDTAAAGSIHIWFRAIVASSSLVIELRPSKMRLRFLQEGDGSAGPTRIVLLPSGTPATLERQVSLHLAGCAQQDGAPAGRGAAGVSQELQTAVEDLSDRLRATSGVDREIVLQPRWAVCRPVDAAAVAEQGGADSSNDAGFLWPASLCLVDRRPLAKRDPRTATGAGRSGRRHPFGPSLPVQEVSRIALEMLQGLNAAPSEPAPPLDIDADVLRPDASPTSSPLIMEDEDEDESGSEKEAGDSVEQVTIAHGLGIDPLRQKPTIEATQRESGFTSEQALRSAASPMASEERQAGLVASGSEPGVGTQPASTKDQRSLSIAGAGTASTDAMAIDLPDIAQAANVGGPSPLQWSMSMVAAEGSRPASHVGASRRQSLDDVVFEPDAPTQKRGGGGGAGEGDMFDSFGLVTEDDFSFFDEGAFDLGPTFRGLDVDFSHSEPTDALHGAINGEHQGASERDGSMQATIADPDSTALVGMDLGAALDHLDDSGLEALLAPPPLGHLGSVSHAATNSVVAGKTDSVEATATAAVTANPTDIAPDDAATAEVEAARERTTEAATPAGVPAARMQTAKTSSDAMSPTGTRDLNHRVTTEKGQHGSTVLVPVSAFLHPSVPASAAAPAAAGMTRTATTTTTTTAMATTIPAVDIPRPSQGELAGAGMHDTPRDGGSSMGSFTDIPSLPGCTPCSIMSNSPAFGNSMAKTPRTPFSPDDEMHPSVIAIEGGSSTSHMYRDGSGLIVDVGGAVVEPATYQGLVGMRSAANDAVLQAIGPQIGNGTTSVEPVGGITSKAPPLVPIAFLPLTQQQQHRELQQRRLGWQHRGQPLDLHRKYGQLGKFGSSPGSGGGSAADRHGLKGSRSLSSASATVTTQSAGNSRQKAEVSKNQAGQARHSSPAKASSAAGGPGSVGRSTTDGAAAAKQTRTKEELRQLRISRFKLPFVSGARRGREAAAAAALSSPQIDCVDAKSYRAASDHSDNDSSSDDDDDVDSDDDSDSGSDEEAAATQMAVQNLKLLQRATVAHRLHQHLPWTGISATSTHTGALPGVDATAASERQRRRGPLCSCRGHSAEELTTLATWLVENATFRATFSPSRRGLSAPGKARLGGGDAGPRLTRGKLGSSDVLDLMPSFSSLVVSAAGDAPSVEVATVQQRGSATPGPTLQDFLGAGVDKLAPMSSDRTSSDTAATARLIHVLDPPRIAVGTQGSVIEAVPTALPFWDKLNLQAVGGRKECIVKVLQLPTSRERQEQVHAWLGRVGRAFETFGLGSHNAAPKAVLALGEETDVGLSSYLDKLPCDVWLDTIGSIASHIQEYLKEGRHAVLYLVQRAESDACRQSGYRGLTRLEHELRSMLQELGGEASGRFLVCPVSPDFVSESGSIGLGASGDGMRHFVFSLYDQLHRVVERRVPKLLHPEPSTVHTALVQYPSFSILPTDAAASRSDSSCGDKTVHPRQLEPQWLSPSASLFEDDMFLHVAYDLLPRAAAATATANDRPLDGGVPSSTPLDEGEDGGRFGDNHNDHAEDDAAGLTIVSSIDNRAQSHNVKVWKMSGSLKAELASIWHYALQQARRANVSWHIVICRAGPMGIEELRAWSELATEGLNTADGIVGTDYHVKDVTIACLDADSAPILLPTRTGPPAHADWAVAPPNAHQGIVHDASSTSYAIFPWTRMVVSPSRGSGHGKVETAGLFNEDGEQRRGEILALRSAMLVHCDRRGTLSLSSEDSGSSDGEGDDEAEDGRGRRATSPTGLPSVHCVHILQVHRKEAKVTRQRRKLHGATTEQVEMQQGLGTATGSTTDEQRRQVEVDALAQLDGRLRDIAQSFNDLKVVSRWRHALPSPWCKVAWHIAVVQMVDRLLHR